MKEFRLEAVKLVTEEQLSWAEAARRLFCRDKQRGGNDE